jgi:SsrA-binding protein
MSYKEITILLNKKIYHDYDIKKKYSAGIVLNGWEVKSIKKKKFQITNSYAIIKSGELFLIGMLINPLYKIKLDTDPLRTRKLLLNKIEIKKIIDIKSKDQLSIVALRCFLKCNFIKIELAIVRGKKNYDKRNALKEKDWKKKESILLRNKNIG